MAALRSGRPCFLAAVACLAVLADRNVDSNATHEDGDASYAKAALGAHLSFAKFNRSAGDAAPAAAGSNLPAGASANVAVATAAAFEPVKIEDSEKPDKVVKVEDADAVGQAGRGATAHGEMEHPEEQSPAMKAVIAAQEDLGSDEGSRELAMAAAATAKVLHEAPKDELLAESMGTSTQGNDLRRRRTAYPSNPGTYPGKAKEPTATPEITHRRGAPLPTSVDLQVQKLRRVAVEAKRSRDAAAQMILGQLAQPVEPRGGDARHRSMPLRHPHGVNPTMLASSGAGVSRGSTSAKTASTLELHAIQALAANRSAVQLHASKELPIFASAEQAPAPAPASPAANSSNTIALDNHSAVQLAEQEPPLEPPPGGSGVVSSQALDEATKADIQLRVKTFMAFAAGTALASGFGGIAHNILDIYWRRGEAMGKGWSEENSAWMFPWFVCMVVTPVSIMGSVAHVFAFRGQDVLPAAMAIAGFLSAYEAYVMLTSQTDSTGTASAYASLLAGLVDTIVAGLSLPAAHAGGAVLFIGALFQFFAFLFISVLVPASCRASTLEVRANCPFPEQFNHNAAFHVLVMGQVVFFAWAVRSAASAGAGPKHLGYQRARG